MSSEAESAGFRFGFVSIIGKPNVGKSTLLNKIIGHKLAIVTSRPQTTRNRIMGIKNLVGGQIVFYDTPGIHDAKHKLGEFLVKTAVAAVKETELTYFVTDPTPADDTDIGIIKTLKEQSKPSFLLINKTDTVSDKSRLLRVIDEYRDLYDFSEIIPISAKTGDGIDILLEKTLRLLPEGPAGFSTDVLTDKFERFMAAEIIREKAMELTYEELPHALAVEIVTWKEKSKNLVSISANIYVEKDSQKGIIIGKRGALLKETGSRARLEIERLLGAKVYLELFVKVRDKWRKDANTLKELGYS
ncbi:GTPase Era [Candidatus Magnetomonas plexicatena]|uniref:GTPase Era n=1 Tax=Candidatus Magnetomonas plexicatena TaxID=2552947 RepID=UPI0011013DE4|nr:GTPase Era [Nitrospirales bacterium LBB_01]